MKTEELPAPTTENAPGSLRKRAILVTCSEEYEMLQKRMDFLMTRRTRFQPVLECIQSHNLDLGEVIDYLCEKRDTAAERVCKKEETN